MGFGDDRGFRDFIKGLRRRVDTSFGFVDFIKLKSWWLHWLARRDDLSRSGPRDWFVVEHGGGHGSTTAVVPLLGVVIPVER